MHYFIITFFYYLITSNKQSIAYNITKQSVTLMVTGDSKMISKYFKHVSYYFFFYRFQWKHKAIKISFHFKSPIHDLIR